MAEAELKKLSMKKINSYWFFLEFNLYGNDVKKAEINIQTRSLISIGFNTEETY